MILCMVGIQHYRGMKLKGLATSKLDFSVEYFSNFRLTFLLHVHPSLNVFGGIYVKIPNVNEITPHDGFALLVRARGMILHTWIGTTTSSLSMLHLLVESVSRLVWMWM